MNLRLSIIALLMLSGCMGTHRDDHLFRPLLSPRSKSLHKPVVAVIEFENRSGFRGQWNLGSGMADLLVTHLLDSDRFVVLERKALDRMLKELKLQDSDLFREEGRAQLGRLKNAQYLIRGVVTDFTVSGDASGWFAGEGGGAKLLGSRARVAINLMIFEIETGQIISSVETAGSVGSIGLGGHVKYNDYTFGSEAFFRTPLGKACTQAIREAIEQIEADLPLQPWTPSIAEVSGNTVIISGGNNVGMRPGSTYLVRGDPRRVTDPATGNVIESLPGPAKGRIEIIEVKPLSSHARLLSGTASRGDPLDPE